MYPPRLLLLGLPASMLLGTRSSFIQENPTAFRKDEQEIYRCAGEASTCLPSTEFTPHGRRLHTELNFLGTPRLTHE